MSWDTTNNAAENAGFTFSSSPNEVQSMRCVQAGLYFGTPQAVLRILPCLLST